MFPWVGTGGGFPFPAGGGAGRVPHGCSLPAGCPSVSVPPPTPDSDALRARLYARYRSASPDGADVPLAVRQQQAQSHLLRIVDRCFPPDRGAVVVDLGCGPGFLLAAARQRGYTAVRGIDHAPEQVAAARTLGIGGVEQGDLSATLAAFAPGSLDAVVMLDVLEHLRRDELLPVVDGVWAALKPGGRWIIQVPNGESPFFGRLQYGDLTHETAFTRLSLGQVLRASGFSRTRFFETEPAGRGLRGAVRRAAWRVMRGLLRAWILVETGDSGRGAVFTQTLLAVGIKDGGAVGNGKDGEA